MMLINEKINFKKKCTQVQAHELEKIISILEIELANANLNGASIIGLSAPQISIYKKVAIIRINKFKLDLVNPKIIKSFDKDIFLNESCVSFPNLVVNTKRFKEIVVYNDFTFPEKFVATGILSVAIQHQIDYLDSEKFFERTT